MGLKILKLLVVISSLVTKSYANCDVNTESCEIEDCVSAEKDTECGMTLEGPAGSISYTKLSNLDNKTRSCQYLIDTSPAQKLKIGLLRNSCANMSHYRRYDKTIQFFVYRINPDDENGPLGNPLVLSVPNGTMYEMKGSLFLIIYYDNWEVKQNMGLTFTLHYESVKTNDEISGSLPTFQNHVIKEKAGTSLGFFTSSPSNFPGSYGYTTWLISGRIFENRMISYLKFMELQYVNFGKDCKSCALTFVGLDGRPFLMRSFYMSSKYPIRVQDDIFAPCLVTFKYQNLSSHFSPKFQLFWQYL